MEKKPLPPTFWLPLLLSAVPVLAALHFTVMTNLVSNAWIELDELLSLWPQYFPESQRQETAVALLKWFSAAAALLPVVLFPIPLVLSIRHYRKNKKEEGDEESGEEALHRSLPLIVTLCVWLPILLFIGAGVWVIFYEQL